MARLRVPRAAATEIDGVALQEGEIVHDTTNDNLRLGDGSTLGGKRLVDAASDVTISAAMTPVVQAASVNAASTIIDNVTDSPVAIAATPVTNPAFETKSGRWLTGETKEENKREFLDSVEFISSKGSTEATNLQDKVARFTAMKMKAGSGDGWATNELLVIDASVGNKSAHITEADINNNNQHYGNGLAALGLVAPTCFGHHVTGFSAYNTTSAYMVSMAAGSTGFHNRGFTVGPTSVLQSAFENHSDCDVAFANYGNPDYFFYSSSNSAQGYLGGELGIGGLPSAGIRLTIADDGDALTSLQGTTSAAHRLRDLSAATNQEIVDLDWDDGVFSVIARNDDGSVRNTPLEVDTINNRVTANEVRVGNTGLRLADTNASHHLIVAPGSNLAADRTLTVTTGDADHTINVSGLATTGVFADGTYTPTLTGVANVDASTAFACQYMRVGDTVTVSGKVEVDPTAAAALTQLGISLPIASDFSAQEQCAGFIISPGTNGYGQIYADATNNRAEAFWVPGADSNQPFFFQFTYRVV